MSTLGRQVIDTNRRERNSGKSPLVLSIVTLSWNRLELLRTTLLSLIANTTLPYEIIVVDNNSHPDCRSWLEKFASHQPTTEVISLDQNIGGEAINIGLERAKGEYILVSENDLEYLPNWDINMLHQFETFPELGQLSPFSPFPMKEIGEVWNDKPYDSIKTAEGELKVATQNVGTSCVIRKEIRDQGVRFTNVTSNDDQVKLPADAKFSSDIKELGYLVAWSNEYQVINWGHIKNTWDSDYYNQNWSVKSSSGIDGLGDFNEFIESLTNKNDQERDQIWKTKLGELLQELETEKNKPLPSSAFSVPSTLFVSQDGDFTSQSIRIERANPYNLDFEIVFNLADFEHIDQLRWDPYEGKYCEVNIESIELTSPNGQVHDVDLSLVKHNGVSPIKTAYTLFDTTDPSFYFPANGIFESCIIKGKWRISQPQEVKQSLNKNLGKVITGQYLFEIDGLSDIYDLLFLDGHPVFNRPLEAISVSVLHANQSRLELLINFDKACKELWLNYDLLERGNDTVSFCLRPASKTHIFMKRLLRTRPARFLFQFWSKAHTPHLVLKFYELPLGSDLQALNRLLPIGTDK